MKAKQSTGIFWIALVAAVALLAACEGPRGPKGDDGLSGLPGEEGPVGPDGPANVYTVTYYLGGGTRIGGDITPERVLLGGKVTMPLRGPTKALSKQDGGLDYLEPGLYATSEGALAQPFEAWDVEETGEDNVKYLREWDFDSDVVTGDVLLIARFGQPAAEVLGAGWIPPTDNGFPAAAFNYINTKAGGEYTLILPGEDGNGDPMVYTTTLPQLTQQNTVLYIRSRGIGGVPPNYQAVPWVPGVPPMPAVVTFEKPADTGAILLHVGTSGNGSGSNVSVTIGHNIVLKGSSNNKPAVVISGGATLVMEGFNELGVTINPGDPEATPDPIPPTYGDYFAPKITGNTNSASGDDHLATTTGNMYRSGGAAVGVYSGTFIMQGDSAVTGNFAGSGSYYGIRTHGVFVYPWGKLEMGDNARVEKNGYADYLTLVGTLSSSSASSAQKLDALHTLVSADVFIDKQNNDNTNPTAVGKLTMGGKAFIGLLSLSDYGGNSQTNVPYISIKSAMTAAFPTDRIMINLWRRNNVDDNNPTNGLTPYFWMGGTRIISPEGNYTPTSTDIGRFKLHMRTGWNSNTSTALRLCFPNDGTVMTSDGISATTVEGIITGATVQQKN